MVENTSGIYPVGERILVKPEKLEEVSAGGIVFVHDTVEQHSNASVLGVLVGVGPDAWSDYPSPWARVGMRVMFAQYHGNKVRGKDGEEYRMLNDRDITAVVDAEVDGLSLNRREPLKKQK